MESYNIYMTGVGGQGIGLLSEILMRAADHAGYAFKSVDTHGLAQRGGMVESQLRLGPAVHTPLIPAGEADLVVALERHEALRGLLLMARKTARSSTTTRSGSPLTSAWVKPGRSPRTTCKPGAKNRGSTWCAFMTRA